ncbi:probable enoyl-CoA hydratase [Cylas formicarius]|uniref:probable enoyl-CoA hydratase n=1 Tax=Cylas formicarius TaxID=197179 RepID=UPI002958340F|nr:probable enoyl-CoA hydratase [Cylas formicarius]
MFRSTLHVAKRNISSIKNGIVTEAVGQIVTIGLNRPEKRNCIDTDTAVKLNKAINEFEEDDSSLVAVLYGVGGNFCSGYDLSELSQADLDNEDLISQMMMVPRIKHTQKPMVAALSGFTIAGGMELALLCDLRVMEDTAVMGFYGRRFGVPLVDGATVRLPAMVGLSKALDLILTGRTLNAKEAFEWGLANRIVACGTSLGQAIQLATSLVKFPQRCLKSDRKSIYNSAFIQIFDELLEFEKKNANKLDKSSIIVGAKKFMSGIGKHGKAYNLSEKQKYDWEKEFDDTFKNKL